MKKINMIFKNCILYFLYYSRVKNIFNVTKNELLLVSNIKLNLYDLINNQYEKSFAELSSQQNEEFQNVFIIIIIIIII